MPFNIAKQYESYHLIPQSTDLALNPPESYFFITDFLIIFCGILYTFCYLFYTIRTYSDRYLAGTVQFLSATMAYEIYYAYVCTTTNFQRACFFVWFLFDITFVTVALKYAYGEGERKRAVGKLAWQVPFVGAWEGLGGREGAEDGVLDGVVFGVADWVGADILFGEE
jgi:hypothetical protein